MRLFGALALVLLPLSACNPTFAPPMRSTMYGAPGRLGPGQGEIAVSATSQATGSASLALPIATDARVELSGDYSQYWTMFSAGMRLTWAPPERHLVSDLEFGIGGGLGGSLCGNQVSRQSNCDGGGSAWDGYGVSQRTAVGAYAGGGLGLRFGIFTLFARARLQGSTATDIPVTFWWSALGGGELRLGPLRTYVGIGGAGFVNSADESQGLLLEAGVSVPFNVH